MKFLTYKDGADLRVGALDDSHGVLDLVKAAKTLLGKDLPDSLRGIIEGGDDALNLARQTHKAALAKPDGLFTAVDKITFATPLPGARKNVFCVGRNYKAHIEEMAASFGRAAEFPKAPEFFSKPPTTIIGPGDAIEHNADITRQLDWEVELAVIIGVGGKNIARVDAMKHVYGYTIVNDVTARDVQMRHQQWDMGKSFDTFCPMGPWIVTADELDGQHTRVRCWVNDSLRQDGRTEDLIFDIPTLIETISRGITLYPGDVIATGTPAGVGLGLKPPVFLKKGDVVRIEIDGIGTLQNAFV